MNQMKKIILVLAVILVSATGCGPDGTKWSISNDGKTLTISGKGEMPDYEFLEEGTAYLPWDSYMESITAVIVKEGVTRIGNEAFEDCRSLTSVTLPGSVTAIGDGTFYGCHSLTSVTLPSSVTAIEEGAFGSCRSLTSVIIPASVKAIGDRAFSGCRSLTAITVEKESSFFSSINGVLFDKAGTVLLQCPGGKTGHYTIPNSVTAIGDYAFSDCSSLTSVTIPSSVTEIGRVAFSGCSSLTSVTLSACVTEIGWGTFSDCSSLTAVTIPASVTEIGWGAFSDCSSLKSVTIPASVTRIGDMAFADCSSLRDVTVGWKTPLTIEDDTFEDLPLKSATLHVPDGTKARYQASDGWKEFGIITECN
jgi:hypothetical protein